MLGQPYLGSIGSSCGPLCRREIKIAKIPLYTIMTVVVPIASDFEHVCHQSSQISRRQHGRNTMKISW
jgi:hypothetical protein